MKKLVTFLTTITLLGATALVSACNNQEPQSKGTVTVAVNTQYEISKLFEGKDDLFSVAIKTPSGSAYKINGRKLTFSNLGTYQFIHADGSITNIAVKDELAPSIYLNLNDYQPKAGEETSIPFVAVDNYDGEDISVCVKASGLETSNRFIPSEKGLDLVLFATDKSNNVAETKIYLVPVDTRFTASSTMFGEQDVTGYAVSYKITEYSKGANTSYLGNSATAQAGKYYMITATAKQANKILTATEYYVPML